MRKFQLHLKSTIWIKMDLSPMVMMGFDFENQNRNDRFFCSL